jgi:hypothetical protein
VTRWGKCVWRRARAVNIKAPRTSELRQARRELEAAQARFRAAVCGTDPEATWQAGERLHHARRKVARLGRGQALIDEPGVRRSSMTD